MLLAQSGGFGLPHELWMMIFLIGLPVGAGLLCGIVSIIAKNWRKLRIAEGEARLKEAMILQGRPTDEIERVINASAHGVKKDD